MLLVGLVGLGLAFMGGALSPQGLSAQDAPQGTSIEQPDQLPTGEALLGTGTWSQLSDPSDHNYSWMALVGSGFFECFNFEVWGLPFSADCFGDRSAEDANREAAHAGSVWWRSGLANVASILQLVEQAASQFQSFKGLFNTIKDALGGFDPENPERTIYRLSYASDVAIHRMDQHDYAQGRLSGIQLPDSRLDKLSVIAQRALGIVRDADQHNRGLYQRIGKQYSQLGEGDVKFGGLGANVAMGQRPPPGSAGLPNINVYELEDELLYPPEALAGVSDSMPEDFAADRPVTFFRRMTTQAKGARMTSKSVNSDVRRWRQIIETLQAREYSYEREKELKHVLQGYPQ